MTIKDLVQDRLMKRDEMQEQVSKIETYVSVDDVTQQMIIRSEYKAENTKAINKIKENIEELEREIRKLREANTDVSNQNKRIERYKWNLISERKDNE